MTECKRGPSGDVDGKLSSIWSAHRMGGMVILGRASRTATGKGLLCPAGSGLP